MPESPSEWFLAALTAVMVGLSKTGVPGVGSLVVPAMAVLFGPRLSVGALLPMLIAADVFAVAWYRRHCRWDVLRGLMGPVLIGLTIGGAFLWLLGQIQTARDLLGPTIGVIVLGMLVLHLLRQRLGERFTLASQGGARFAGIMAGFTTTVSNAAGPVMSVYMSSIRLNKDEFMGTSAWFYFAVNVTKVPVLIWLTLNNPSAPMLNASTLTFNGIVLPAIVAGAFLGKWLLPRIPARTFEAIVLGLSALGAIKLILG